ncbi:nitrilase [Trichophaea hybrida]|nr:nitrilase [Trichophaea hybrida]
MTTRIACGQFRATNNVTQNLAICQTLIQRAAALGAKALFLPEASDYISTSPSEALSLCTPATTSPFVLGLQSHARQFSLAVTVGIHTPSTTPDRVYNTSIYISPSGELTPHYYHKLHLFDISLPTVQLHESATTEPGRSLAPPFATPFGSLGMQICFDLRFPEAARALVARGAQVLAYPSAFTVPTGRAHWELLLRARAVETQCWVVAAAQGGKHNEKRVSWGGACVVDPWGTVVARCKDGGEEAGEPEVCVADIDLAMVEKVRKECPLRRRFDVYLEI